jgi:hypothetical protein
MKRPYSQRGAKRITRYEDNPVQYAMFGMNYGGYPVVASNVTNSKPTISMPTGVQRT